MSLDSKNTMTTTATTDDEDRGATAARKKASHGSKASSLLQSEPSDAHRYQDTHHIQQQQHRVRRAGPKPGFIRVKLIELDPPPDSLLKLRDTTIEPYCMINIKEMDTASTAGKEKRANKKRMAPMVVATFNAQTNTVNMVQTERKKKEGGKRTSSLIVIFFFGLPN
jgi:hypothetical protein